MHLIVRSILSSLLLISTAAAAPLRVGAAAVELEADDEMVIAGGIAPGRATGQEGKLRAVAIVIEKAPLGKIAIVACDVLFVPGDMVGAALSEIEKRCGIAPENVLINATHTHHAPSITEVHGYGVDETFKKRVEQGIIDAVIAADANLDGGESRLLFRLGEEKTIGANSRLRMKDGRIYWVGAMDDAVGPTGPFDPQLPVLAFRGPGDELRALLFNHSTHTIGTQNGGVRSPGFYGLAAQELEAELGGVACFLEGASGSTHNITGVSTAQAVERLKAAINEVLAKAEERPVDRLKSIKRRFTFKVRTFNEAVEEEKVTSYCRKYIPGDAEYVAGVFRAMREKLASQQGRERQTWLQAIAIDDIAIVGLPAEYFTVLGVDIKKRSPFPNTVVAELANDWIGYLPDREGHELGGYQTWMGLHSYAEIGTGERVADEVVEMLKELRGE